MRCLSAGFGVWLALGAFLAPCAAPTFAQTPPLPMAPDADALSRAIPPAQGVALSVESQNFKLSTGADLPGPQPTVAQIAQTFGRITRQFGLVTAVAPSQITVVNLPPDTPNPYADMPPAQALKMLAATFNAAQWKAFLSAGGVGDADFAEDAQHALFAALFPDGHLKFIRDNPNGPNDPKSQQDISGPALGAARLRVGYLVSLALPNVGKPDVHTFAADSEPADAPARYFMTNAHSGDADREFGATVREQVPNTPKPGDLRWTAPAFQAAVSLSNVRTVDDLAARIGIATHTELYADPRLGARKVTLLGPARTARVGDLLPALALCVGGTFRRVGPAYVLTDDLAGMGTRHAAWKAFEDRAKEMQASGGSNENGTNGPLASPYTQQDISWGGDPLAFTPAQRKAYWDGQKTSPSFSGGMLDITLPLDKLSPAQQQAAQTTLDADQKMHLDVTLDGTIMVQAEPELELVLPGLDGPIFVFQSYDNLLPPPGSASAFTPFAAPPGPPMPAPLRPAPPAPPGSLRDVLRTFPRRAARIAPKTEADVDSGMAALRTLGFNEAWVQVPLQAQPGADANAVALIARAVKAGRAAGIVVYPELHLLDWGKDAPPALRDRDLLGLTPTGARQAGISRPSPIDAPDTVSPFDPAVTSRLASLVQRLGTIPTLGGMVWNDWMPTGYQPVSGDGFDSVYGDQLGYAEAGRLAFLRQSHADPIDVYTTHYTDSRAHVSVPGFGDNRTVDGALYDRWRQARADAIRRLSLRLASALPAAFRPSTGAHAAILVPPYNEPFTSLYGTWDDLRQPPPSVEFVPVKGADGKPLANGSVTQKMRSARVYSVLLVSPPPRQSAQATAQEIASDLRREPPSSGIVLDTTSDASLLPALAAWVTAAQALAASAPSAR